MLNWLVGKPFPWFTKRQNILYYLFCSLHAPTSQREDARQSHLPLATRKRPVTTVTTGTLLTTVTTGTLLTTVTTGTLLTTVTTGTLLTTVTTRTLQNKKEVCHNWNFAHNCHNWNFAHNCHNWNFAHNGSLHLGNELPTLQFIASFVVAPLCSLTNSSGQEWHAHQPYPTPTSVASPTRHRWLHLSTIIIASVGVGGKRSLLVILLSVPNFSSQTFIASVGRGHLLMHIGIEIHFPTSSVSKVYDLLRIKA
jgi:hypothetical protein